MKFILTAFLICVSTLCFSQAKQDSIKSLGEVWVTEKVKTFYLDSNVKSVLLRAPMPKIKRNFTYTSGTKRYRIILYANGVYTETLIK